ncbi:MAG: phosphoribosyltransferase-like protein [Candidatus Saccharibacteria bacterium]|nr:phosphoribosyltransferase-like protein [Candidatus Saccharibacteria bacterium]
MADKVFSEFEATLQKSNQMLSELEDELGWQDRHRQSYAAMREVLHALRDRLPFREALQLSAQLPMLMAGVFVDGWKPKDKPVKMTAEEMYQRIAQHFPYSVEGGVPMMVHAVWQVLKRHVSPGELEDIEANLPKEFVFSLEGKNRLPVM